MIKLKLIVNIYINNKNNQVNKIMIIFIKHRYYFYRRFEHDIWGLCYLDLKASTIGWNNFELTESNLLFDFHKISVDKLTLKIKNNYNIMKLYKNNKNNKHNIWDYLNTLKKKRKDHYTEMDILRKKILFIEKYGLWQKTLIKPKDQQLYNIDNYDNVRSLKSWLLRFFYRLYYIHLQRKYEKMRRYIYRIDIITHTKKRRKFNKRFLSLRIARLYFLTLKDYQFRSLFKRASKLNGNLESNYCLLLECRIMAIFYRTNFLHNIFEILQYIKSGNVYINYKKETYINNNISNTSRITCSKNTIYRLRLLLKRRLDSQIILFNTPKFLFISYYFFFAYICKLPLKKDFVYPFSLDIQRITGYN